MSKGDKTRQRIVAEAATLFNQHGFEGCSMAALMEATGLEKGGIYRHFSSKEAIAAEAFDYAWQSAFDVRVRNLETIPNSVDKLRQFITNFIEQPPAIAGGCPMFNTAIDADDGNPVLRERARKALRGWLDILTVIVKNGIEAGEIQPEVDPRKLVTLIVSSLEGALAMSRLERNREPLAAVRTHLEDHLERDIRARQNRKARASAR